MIKKVIIFGGSGFLGSYLSEELLNNGYRVTIADIKPPKFHIPKVKFKKVNILEIEDVKSVIQNADAVYNLASLANLDDSKKDPFKTININVIGNLNLLQACVLNGKIKRFVYASSAYALNNKGSFYGISKQMSEKIIVEYNNNYNLKYTILRYGSIYGQRTFHNNYLYNLIYQGIKKGVLYYDGDGNDLREFIHASDIANLSVKVLNDKKFENKNVILTGMEKIKRLDLLKMINEIMQNKLKIKKNKKKNIGHYKTTPYSFHPDTAKKFFSSSYIDLGQGILECIQEIDQELKNEKNSKLN